MSSENINDNRSWSSAIAKGTFLLLTCALFIAVVYILRSVLHAIILGVLFALLLMPLNELILRRVGKLFGIEITSPEEVAVGGEKPSKREARCRSIAAMLSVILVVVVVMVPLTMFGISIVRQGYGITVTAQGWIVRELPGRIQAAIEKYHLQERLDKLTRAYSSFNSMMAGAAEEDGRDKAAEKAQPPLPSSGEEPADSAEVSENTANQSLAAKVDEADKAADNAPQATAGETPQPTADNTSQASDDDTTQVADALQQASNEQQLPPRHSLESMNTEQQLTGHVNFSKDAGPYVAKLAGTVMEFLRDTLLELFSRVGVVLFNFCVMLFVMYQFFYDGRHMLAYVKSISPLSDDAMKRVETRVREVSRAIVYGIFGTAVTQGICAIIVFKIAGIPVFWGVVLGFCSIIPVVGTSIIWVPVVVYLFLIGDYGRAIFIFFTCGCIIANFDMILRPLLMKRSGETGMSYMVLFLSILGGIQTFGLVGIIYGPLITGICSICLLIFSTQFKAKQEQTEITEIQGDS